MSEMIPFSDSTRMADLMSKSSLLPPALRNKPQDVFVLIQMGVELGLRPMQAINGIHVIQGKPTIAPQTMLALIYSRNKDAVVEVIEDLQKQEVRCTMKRTKDHAGYTSSWDMERAKKMGLVGKDSWNKQAMTMLKWRSISDAARVVFPDVIQGFYTPEEMDPDLNLDEVGNPAEPIKVQSLAQNPEPKKEPQPNFVKIYQYILKKTTDKESAKALWDDLKLEKKEYTGEETQQFLKEIDIRVNS